MKKILLLLLLFISTSIFGQAEYEKIKLTANVQDDTAVKISVQSSSSNEINWTTILNIINQPKLSTDTLKFNLGEDVTWNVDFNTLNIPTGLGPTGMVAKSSLKKGLTGSVSITETLSEVKFTT